MCRVRRAEKSKRSARSLILAVGAAVAVGVVLLSLRAIVHATPEACASCHMMEPSVQGWRQGVHRGVECMDCHEGDLVLETKNLVATLAGNPSTATHDFKGSCTSCHPPHPRWARIASVVAKDPKSDGAWQDLLEVARAHGQTTGCRTCHGRTAHGSATLWAQVAGPEVVVDGRGDDPAWARAQPLDVVVMGGHTIGRIAVELRALVSGNDLLIRARWPDRRDDAEKAMWKLGEDGSWAQLGRQRAGEPGNEDRILFLFNQSVPQFEKSGCLETCHLEVNASKFLDRPGMGDIWHFKAARTRPAGYCDDKYIDHIRRGDDGGRHGDATNEQPGYRDNRRPDEQGPAWMHDPKVLPKDSRFLPAEHAVPIPSDLELPVGTRIPGYVTARPDGSRGDVEAGARWHDGVWTVELRRALDTGHGDDVRFERGGAHAFAIAVVDNASGAEHAFSGVLRLRIPSH